MIVVTGATGHLGRLVVHGLLKKVPAREIVAAVRSPEKAADLAASGVQVREADYSKPETLAAALAGADRLLLISSSEVGKRAQQHAAVIDAAKRAGVGLIAYTSCLRADTSKLGLAAEHKATEERIRVSGLPYVFLRNGWYLENYTEHLGPALEHGAIPGSAGKGRVAAAARADYAAAAVAVLTATGNEKKIYELAGDFPFTMAELAVGGLEARRQDGRLQRPAEGAVQGGAHRRWTAGAGRRALRGLRRRHRARGARRLHGRSEAADRTAYDSARRRRRRGAGEELSVTGEHGSTLCLSRGAAPQAHLDH